MNCGLRTNTLDELIYKIAKNNQFGETNCLRGYAEFNPDESDESKQDKPALLFNEENFKKMEEGKLYEILLKKGAVVRDKSYTGDRDCLDKPEDDGPPRVWELTPLILGSKGFLVSARNFPM